MTLTMLTAYDATMASIIDQCDIDMILVGDSLGNVVAGHKNTLPVTMDNMVYHTQMVTRGVENAMVIADMPFLSDSVQDAGRLIKEGGAQAVKMEVIPAKLDAVKAIVDNGIPVMAHIGFVPQYVYQLGGYKVQGKTAASAKELLELAKKLEKIGCMAVLLELVPHELAQKITKAITIPTIGIGAGPHCTGQVLVTHDLLGFTLKKVPKFVKQYTNIAKDMQTAIRAYKREVENGQFPAV